MINTFQIYETLSQSLGPEAARALANVLGQVYDDLQQTATRSDVLELRAVVADLAEAQKRTEQRVEELAEAQQRTEQRVEELAKAQQQTEQRVDSLTQRVEELAAAQQRTEQVMAEGFRAVDRRFDLLERRFDLLERRFDLLERRFGVLGSRWGDDAEEAFRQGLLEVVRDLGYTVEHYQGQDPEGFINYTPRSFDLDVLVRDGELVVAEIKSNASGADVAEFHRSVLLYEKQTGRRATKRILVAVTIQSLALKRAEELDVIVATGFNALEGKD